MVQKLIEVWEPHEVAETVSDDRGSDVACSDKQECRVHSKDGRVGTLKKESTLFRTFLHVENRFRTLA